MDFTLSPEIEDLRLRVRAFIDKEVLPLENDPVNFSEHENIPEERIKPVREKARKAGLWAPQSPKEYGGMELPIVAWAAIYEEAARSLFGPLAINCMAPDDGNMNLLRLVGTREQKEKWLETDRRWQGALVLRHDRAASGLRLRSVDDAAPAPRRREANTSSRAANGSSPAPTAQRISFSSRAPQTTSGAASPPFSSTWTSPAGASSAASTSSGRKRHGGHCELEFDGLEVPEENVLMGVGDGLKATQIRLGPARLTHCMRWTGWAKRCLEIAQAYVSEREGFGIKLGDRESVQIKLGEVAQQIQISRLLTMHAAWMLDQGGRARKEVSMAKVQVADTLHKAADVAIQLQGARGFSKDTPVEWIYRAARAARLVDGASEVHMMVLSRFLREEGRDFWQWGPGEGRRNAP